MPENECLFGGQFRIRLDSRLKHAGMTIFGKEIRLMQPAAGNWTRRCLTRSALFLQSPELERQLIHVALGKPIARAQ
jgi:hypothetical protein